VISLIEYVECVLVGVSSELGHAGRVPCNACGRRCCTAMQRCLGAPPELDCCTTCPRAGRTTRTSPPPDQTAASAGLQYVTDHLPRIRRQRVGSGFRYVTPRGSILRDAKTLQRIRSLAIPRPARDDGVRIRQPGQADALRAIEAVAGILGNTRSVCRKCYIHPGDYRLVLG